MDPAARPTAPENPSLTDRALGAALALSAAVLLWSFVGGAVYLASVDGSLPLQADPLRGVRQLANRGHVDEAVRQYRLACRIDPSDARCPAELGELLLKHGRNAEAALVFEAILATSGRDARALNGLGDARLAEQRYPEAIALYRQLPESSPQRPAILNNLGMAQAMMGDLDKAIASFEAALEAGPNPTAVENLDRARAEKARAAARAVAR